MGRAEDVLEEGLAPALVHRACPRRGMESEPAAPDRQVPVEVPVVRERRQRPSSPRGACGRRRTRGRRRRELGERDGVVALRRGALRRGEGAAILVAVIGEQPAPPEIAGDAPRSVLEHAGDVFGLEPWQRVELHLASGALMEDAVEEDRVHMRVETQVARRPLHDEHRAALPHDAVLLAEPPPVEREHGVGELPHHHAEQRSVESEPTSPRERHRQHPLTGLSRDLRREALRPPRVPPIRLRRERHDAMESPHRLPDEPDPEGLSPGAEERLFAHRGTLHAILRSPLADLAARPRASSPHGRDTFEARAHSAIRRPRSRRSRDGHGEGERKVQGRVPIETKSGS